MGAQPTNGARTGPDPIGHGAGNAASKLVPVLVYDGSSSPVGNGDRRARTPRVMRMALRRCSRADRRCEGRASATAPRFDATKLAEPASTVVQGTLIPAVLETAIDTDVPGYVRAVVSQDVRSFDGSKVLIPRSSRLIGEYKACDTGRSAPRLSDVDAAGPS